MQLPSNSIYIYTVFRINALDSNTGTCRYIYRYIYSCIDPSIRLAIYKCIQERMENEYACVRARVYVCMCVWKREEDYKKESSSFMRFLKHKIIIVDGRGKNRINKWLWRVRKNKHFRWSQKRHVWWLHPSGQRHLSEKVWPQRLRVVLLTYGTRVERVASYLMARSCCLPQSGAWISSRTSLLIPQSLSQIRL